MTCLMAITDQVLREKVSSREKILVQTEKPEMLVWFLNPPGLPLSVVSAAMKQVRPNVRIVILSNRAQLSDEEFQTVDAIATVSSEARYFLPILKPFLSPMTGPVPSLPTNGELKSRKESMHYRSRILDDLKAAVDSLQPTVRRQLIAGFRVVLVEFADAA